MRSISLENKLKYFNQMKGSTQRMLIERIDSRGIARGYGENYLPIQVAGENLERNSFIDVILKEIMNENNEDRMVFNGLLRRTSSQ